MFSFLAPVFFLRAGTMLDLTALDVGSLKVVAVLLTAAVGLKYLATRIATRVLLRGLGHYVGILFNDRLTFGIITASVGLEEGVIDAQLFTVMLAVVLLSGLLPMVLLRDLPNDLDKE